MEYLLGLGIQKHTVPVFKGSESGRGTDESPFHCNSGNKGCMRLEWALINSFGMGTELGKAFWRKIYLSWVLLYE